MLTLADWIDVVLELENPQADYDQTFGNGGSSGTLSSSDGGKTWTGDKLHINEVYFDYPITYDTPSCPGADLTVYKSRASRSYDIECDMTYDGYEIEAKNITSGKIADCVVYCDQTEGCVGVVLSDTACSLKSSQCGQRSKKGDQAAMLQ